MTLRRFLAGVGLYVMAGVFGWGTYVTHRICELLERYGETTTTMIAAATGANAQAAQTFRENAREAAYLVSIVGITRLVFLAMTAIAVIAGTVAFARRSKDNEPKLPKASAPPAPHISAPNP